MNEKIMEILKEINEEILTYTGNNMLEDGLVNSFSFISLVSDIEDEFDIEIDESLMEKEYFGNMDRIISTVKSLVED